MTNSDFHKSSTIPTKMPESWGITKKVPVSALKIAEIVNFFPSEKRELWLRIALNLGIDELVAAEDLEKLVAKNVSDESFQETIILFGECVREAKWVRFGLIRAVNRSYEFLLEAFSTKELILACKEFPAVAEWLVDQSTRSTIPNILEIVPPLNITQLKVIRRSIDKTVKRSQRHPEFPFREWEVTEHEDAFDTPDIGFALEKLPAIQQSAIYLRFVESKTLKEIARTLDLGSTTAAYRLISEAIARLRRILDDQ